jgi:hypothetical protein
MVCRRKTSRLSEHHAFLQLIDFYVSQIDSKVLTRLGYGHVASKDLEILQKTFSSKGKLSLD